MIFLPTVEEQSKQLKKIIHENQEFVPDWRSHQSQHPYHGIIKMNASVSFNKDERHTVRLGFCVDIAGSPCEPLLDLTRGITSILKAYFLSVAGKLFL